MNPPDIHEFSDLIRQRLEELINEDQLGVGAQKVVELDQQSVGRLSRMDALQSQAMAPSPTAPSRWAKIGFAPSFTAYRRGRIWRLHRLW